MRPFRRRKKLIKPALQLKLTFVFFFIGGISLLVQAIMLSRALSQLAGRFPNQELRLLEEVPALVSSNLLVTLAILVPLFLVVGVLLTFRIAGPVYRFEQYLGEVAEGRDPGPCRIRKGDELQDLCTVLNQALTRLRTDQAEAPEGETERRAA